MDDYSRASWGLPLRVKSDVSVEFEKRATVMQNGTGKTVRTVMFDKAKESVTGKRRNSAMSAGSGSSHRSRTHLRLTVLEIILSALHHMERAPCYAIRAYRRVSGPIRGYDDLHVSAKPDANES